jgi:hypothetical protein
MAPSGGPNPKEAIHPEDTQMEDDDVTTVVSETPSTKTDLSKPK